MKPPSLLRRPGPRRAALASALLAATLGSAACATMSSSAPAPAITPTWSAAAPTPDPRVGLEPGLTDPGVASWNMRLVSLTPPTADFVGVTNSDLAFQGDLVYQGNYNGYQVWDISDADDPELVTSYLCPASQSDVSIYGNLLFVSGEGQAGRVDCGIEGVPDSVSADRLRGIRVFDASDPRNPKYIANVQTCRGSHTHTVVSDPRDPNNVYIYVSGSAGVRSPNELPGCSELAPSEDPNSALFRIEVIQVPLADPTRARIVSSPRIFEGLGPPPRHAELPEDMRGRRPRPPARTGPSQCHDITVYPAIGRAGGACGGYGLLLDITDVRNPRRLYAAADSNFSFWHSATFNNDGTKVLFTDEWGGGSQPRCRATDKYEWGANAIFTIRNNALDFHSYYKMPAAQTTLENCVAHNGSLVPVPGRDVMVQGWYQGGISVFDWTDPDNPREIAFFDRGPVDAERMRSGGSWSVYWYNGYLVSSEIARGLDIYELTPSPLLTQNEIDAANTVRFEELNAQEQPQIVWPPSFALARAYLDQLQRDGGLAMDRITAARDALWQAERSSGSERRETLTGLAGSLAADAGRATDAAKVRMLADAVRELAAAQD